MTGPTAATVVSDSIDLPPVRREFWSPDRQFLLVVESADDWRTLYPRASLLDARSAQRPPLWSRLLQQQFGPRAALVSAQGQVLLVDEWINVTSRWALMLLDARDRVVASYDHDAVVAALGVPAERVMQQARMGPWLAAAPVLAADGRSARIPAGGRTLVVSMATGQLTSQA